MRSAVERFGFGVYNFHEWADANGIDLADREDWLAAHIYDYYYEL